MTETIPTEPGWYFARFHARRDFMPVEVTQPNYGFPMRVLITGLGLSFNITEFTWGPRITMPEGLGEGE